MVNFEKIGFEAAALPDKLTAGRIRSPKTLVMESSGDVARQSTDTLAIEDKKVVRSMQPDRDRMRAPVKVTDIARELALSRGTLDRRFRLAYRKKITVTASTR
jgi:LacI family transcriptional regulator